ncbi:MAG: glycoside hydrolase family 31 protein [Bdellovibrionota bacterium]
MRLHALSFLFFSFLFVLGAQAAPLGVKRVAHSFSWDVGSRFLKLEVLDDDLIHFELFERREQDHASHGPKADAPIWTSPMVDGEGGNYKEGYQGPFMYTEHADGVETGELRVTVFNDARCFRIYDKNRRRDLTEICGEELDKDEKFLRIAKKGMQHAYGVGNLFVNGESADGNWSGKQWNARKHGNFRFGPDSFYEGGPSVSQFPVMYALGSGTDNYALFLDQVYRMSWDFTEGDRWSARTWGDELRGFILSGKDLPDLRKDFMQLTGKPPVPPKTVFGHWTSEFGYDNWEEVEKDVSALRETDFPLDGVALDLQWFGQEFDNPKVHRMGVLQFNEAAFPDPRGKIESFYDRYGIQFMPIEESYIDNRLDEHKALYNSDFRKNTPGFSGIVEDDGCYLARHNLDFDGSNNGWNPVNVTTDYQSAGGPEHLVWWGRGGMIDWTNPAARKFWHQLKRHHLSKMGIFSHWLDLGEPEMYYQNAYYRGFPELFREYRDLDGKLVKHVVQQHGDIHNVYNLFWAKGITEGYDRSENKNDLLDTMERIYGTRYQHRPRHFTMSRSGTVGSQRFGGMWSGDVMGNFENLRGHLQTQMHMSLAGVDYYGSDAGGFFHKGRPPEDPYEYNIYTQWFADSSLLDVPLRPHGWGLDEANGDQSFAANVRGHLDSNRANVRRRYELIPYVYSWAHRAHTHGEPVYPPLVYYYQNDPNVRDIGNVKMIGDSLLFGIVANYKEHRRKVYLPRGRWFDYESHQYVDSKGEESDFIPLYRTERVPASELAEDPKRAYFLLPLFAKGGAIIPKMPVDEKTVNTLGKRSDGSRRNELLVKVFADPTASAFELFEDDGVSTGYLHGEKRKTEISQKLSGTVAAVTIEPASGSFIGAEAERENILELVTPGIAIATAKVNGNACGSRKQFDENGTYCWIEKSERLVRIGTKALSVSERKHIVAQ